MQPVFICVATFIVKNIMQPNILFIMADQMTAKALPFYGNDKVIAPNLQKLADTGVVFDNCYCNLPMCGPSRASLHTGKLPFSMQMYDNASEFHADIPVSYTHLTLPTIYSV